MVSKEEASDAATVITFIWFGGQVLWFFSGVNYLLCVFTSSVSLQNWDGVYKTVYDVENGGYGSFTMG